MFNLGHELARSTIAEILKRHGIEPAPERSRKTTWKEFLTRHWELIVAADFFTVTCRSRRAVEAENLFLRKQLALFQERNLRPHLAKRTFDLVVLLSLSNTVQNAIIGNDNSVTGGLIGAFSLLLTNYLVVRFLLRHRRIDQILEGSPTVLVEKGRVHRKALAKELLTESELVTVAHRPGFAHLEDIESCILEPGGTFFVRGKAPSAEESFRVEVLTRLEQLSRRLDGKI